MKVLFIKRNLDRSELELVLALYASGVDIRVMTLPQSMGVDQLSAKGIYVEPKPYASKINLPLIRQIRALVREHGIDLIHSSESKSLANAILATCFLPVKIIAYRGTLAKIRKHDPSYWLGILNPKINKIFCVNQTIYDYLTTLIPQNKLVLNYKGYDPEWSRFSNHSLPGMPELPQDAFVVMYIAQTDGRPHKGLEILIEAIHGTSDTCIHFVHIGSASEAARAQANNGPAANRIHLLGMLPEAAAYLKKAHLFVLPSTRDGLPRAIKEAMACSLPVVSTNIPGPNDLVIDQETGLLVEPGSADALTQAILQLHQNPALRQKLGAGGKQHLLDTFSAQSFVDITLATYQELTATP